MGNKPHDPEVSHPLFVKEVVVFPSIHFRIAEKKTRPCAGDRGRDTDPPSPNRLSFERITWEVVSPSS